MTFRLMHVPVWYLTFLAALRLPVKTLKATSTLCEGMICVQPGASF